MATPLSATGDLYPQHSDTCLACWVAQGQTTSGEYLEHSCLTSSWHQHETGKKVEGQAYVTKTLPGQSLTSIQLILLKNRSGLLTCVFPPDSDVILHITHCFHLVSLMQCDLCEVFPCYLEGCSKTNVQCIITVDWDICYNHSSKTQNGLVDNQWMVDVFSATSGRHRGLCCILLWWMNRDPHVAPR